MEEEKRVADLRVRLTNEEMTRLKEKAKTCNLTVSKFVRYVILKKTNISIREIENHIVEEKIGNLEVHLKKIENGISQLNHHLANGGRVENETSNKISQLITSIDKRINQIEDVIKEVYKWG
jgi:hypothetical protein